MILCIPPAVACPLEVTDGWIREAPPGMTTLAGYARLKNNSDQPIRITKVESTSFAEAQIHQSTIENGMASMRALNVLPIRAHEQLELAPAGKHLMLMGAIAPLKQGDAVRISFRDNQNCVTTAEFKVRRTR
jgi:copper(I)-binding protein